MRSRVVACFLLASVAAVALAEGEPVTFRELMQFRRIEGPVLSRDGSWLAYARRPDRGDGDCVARPVAGGDPLRVRRGSDPRLSSDARWLACAIVPSQRERDDAARRGATGKDAPRRGLALVSLVTGSERRFANVESFVFSEDGAWIAWKLHETGEEKPDEKPDGEAEETAAAEGAAETPPSAPRPEGAPESKEPAPPGEAIPTAVPSPVVASEQTETRDEAADDRPEGTTLRVLELATGRRVEIPFVTSYAFADVGRSLAFVVAEPTGVENGIFVLDSIEDAPADVHSRADADADTRSPPGRRLHGAPDGRYTGLSWAEDRPRLAFVAAVDDVLREPGPADVWVRIGDGEAVRVARSGDAPEGWRIPSAHTPTWSRDGERLFFGYRPIDPVLEERRLERLHEKLVELGEAPPEPVRSYDPYDIEDLLEDRGVDVWHGRDPFIVPHQKKRWNSETDRVWLAVAHVGSPDRGRGARRGGRGGRRDAAATGTDARPRIVRLADEAVPDVRPSDNARAVLATSDRAYRREVTWDGRYADVYRVALDDGERALVAERLRGPVAELSPDGRFVVYWRSPHWYAFDADDGTTRNLTADLEVPFSDEDDDYPGPDPGYGIAAWVAGDRAVLIRDKYDVWRFALADRGDPVNVTDGIGRATGRRFRVLDLDRERDDIDPDAKLLLHAHDEGSKAEGFWTARADRAGAEVALEGPNRFRFLAKAEDADRVVYTREAYDEFPDLWTAKLDFAGPARQSDANPQIAKYAWGRAELVEWESADGTPLQGVLILPAGYEPGTRYPVLVYYYRLFSQRLHQFNPPVVNHRPSFPVYASHGYAVFLPDIRFEVGRPGKSAVDALVPGVQKLVDMGVADSGAIGLHGHSWSGYQTAHVVTQTDRFAAAVAGAPVSNMTSAYGGIRLGSGLARQFQYERGQSRIGGSLDAELPKYLENSPVFHARHVNTPLLIQFGDEDEAVPWQQGIELYLALRRLDKDVVFLQYRGEPHHLKRYANKLDYSIKMKEFFDHHLKGAKAPAWMVDGIPYRGD